MKRRTGVSYRVSLVLGRVPDLHAPVNLRRGGGGGTYRDPESCHTL